MTKRFNIGFIFIKSYSGNITTYNCHNIYTVCVYITKNIQTVTYIRIVRNDQNAFKFSCCSKALMHIKVTLLKYIVLNDKFYRAYINIR